MTERSRSIAAVSSRLIGMWTAPGIRPVSHSLSSRTSIRSGGRSVSSSSCARAAKSSFLQLHLGYARLWAGFGDSAHAAWQAAAAAQPDSPAAQRADDVLHPRFPAGQPFFVPGFATPPGLAHLSPPRQLAALARAA